jgi:hypothetical protein
MKDTLITNNKSINRYNKNIQNKMQNNILWNGLKFILTM